MYFYYGTTIEQANIIKQVGFKEKIIYLTTDINDATVNAGKFGKVIKIFIKNINSLFLDQEYIQNNKNHQSIIYRIAIYVQLNSKKNCLVNKNKKEYIFINNIDYLIINF